METLTIPQGIFQLARYPVYPKETLRAWDAADEYLLRHSAEEQLLHEQTSLLIINDSFGALSVALAAHRPQMLSDSYLAHQGTLANLKNNHQTPEQVQLLNSLQLPHGTPDVVLIKIPKSLAMLEDQLHRIRPLLNEKTRIIGAGMVKGIHSSTLKIFERIIGPTHTSLAAKKARLIFSQLDSSLTPGESPYPKSYTLEGHGFQITNHANVFSRDQLDIGTRFFLQHIPHNVAAQRIIDLGCGNGVVGLVAAAQCPDAELLFLDESFMATASAEVNFRAAFADSRQARFEVTNCLKGVPAESADLILNNPPFHQQHAVGDITAWQMFKESRKILRSGGELMVVGNRHLAYHTKLKRLFGNCNMVASNKKFVVLRAVKEG